MTEAHSGERVTSSNAWLLRLMAWFPVPLGGENGRHADRDSDRFGGLQC